MKRDFSVAVKTVIIKEGKVLCLVRSDKEVRESILNPIDLWDLPGGGLQYYEKLEDGLIREVKEETGLKIKILKPVDAHDIIRPSLHIIFITYLSEYVSGQVELSKEHKKFIWADENELQNLNIQKWLRKIYIKAFDEYKNFNGTM